MIRSLLIELGLFLFPFAIYAAFLAIARKHIADPEHWPLRRIVVLAAIAVVLVAGSLVYLAHFSGAPPGSTYSPARIEDGRFVPGSAK